MFRNSNQTPSSVHTLGKLDSRNHRTDSSERASKSASIATSARGEANMPIHGQNDGGLLKLPPELRLMIYDLIYEEASEAFYGSGGFYMHIYANDEIADEGSITVLNKRIPAALIEYINWLPLVLRRVRHLHLRIHASAESAAICEAQSVLHASLMCLGKSHVLKSIHVAINVCAHRPGRSNHGATLKPQSSPPSQVIDFLTAPLQAIRMGPSQRKALKLTMTGDEGQPLPEIARTTMIAIHERTPLRDFRPMMRYFSTLKAALRCAESRRRSATHIQNVDSLIQDLADRACVGTSPSFGFYTAP
ncbi:hypothetical protein LTR97_005487 [Elasticomyces elasticus]|uniref:Uncharacterized protein n=1 Tax=Elasticomyces elasticus TaxID=574655 RepID=A0AAN7WA72_9PEZI|nr:hypothetical protein LTR97_005487 [Elasticomyces elasticus]